MGGARHAVNFDGEYYYVVIGNRRLSKRIDPPLEFNRRLAEQLTFEPLKPIKFGIVNKRGRSLSEYQCISSATRQIRILSDHDVDLLLSKIH